MKLWIKLTCIVLSSTLAALCVCLFIFTAWQSEQIISGSEAQTMDSLELFCSNFKSLSAAAGVSDSQAANRSAAQYYFAEYDRLMGGGDYYSLAQDGQYLYNACPYDPKSLLTLPPEVELSYETEAEYFEQLQQSRQSCRTVFGTFELDGYRIVAAKRVRVLEQDYAVYITADVTAAHRQVREIKIMSAVMLIISVLTALLITIPLVRRTLKPMESLRRTAESIAGGEYSLRAQVQSGDEVAELARSFNHMADAVEARIEALTEESERRRLLLGALAHELKTPVTAVIGFADSLIKMPLSEEQKRHCAGQILSAGQRTERMAQKLMLLLSIDGGAAPEKKPFVLEPFAEELRRQYGSRVQITAAGEMTGDRDLLLSLTQNLINNALNASDAGGGVIVTLSETEIKVADSGRGIAQEHINRLTEPFYRVDKARSRRHGGAGLGLALCRAIAEAHGGRLIIQSTPGCGTTVTAALPQNLQLDCNLLTSR